MAEGETKQQEGGWWNSWINTAKEQTEKAFEMVSQDLAEFTCTMQNDTKKVVEKTKETLQTVESGEEKNPTDRMKQSFYSLMEGITKVLTVEPEDTSPKHSHTTHPTSDIFDRAKVRLRAVQVDTGTYLHEPTGEPALYASWLESFDIDAHKGEVSELLVTMVEVRSLYTSLVPSEVSHQDFWRRYFYKVHQLQVDEARKQALMKRAERSDVKEESIGWDDEDAWSGDEDTVMVKSPVQQPLEDPSSRLQPNQPMDSKPEPRTTQSSTPDITPVKPAPVTTANIDVKQHSPADDSVRLKEKNSRDDIQDQHIEQSGPIDTVQALQGNIVDSANTPVKQADNAIVSDTRFETVEKVNNEDSEIVTDVQAVAGNQSTENETNEKEGPTAGKEGPTAGLKSAGNTQDDDSVTQKTQVVDMDDTSNLKTKLKGDMVVVGKDDRISPSSESSGNKESVTDEWEQDFDDVDITAEDLQAAHQLANKLNMSAAEYKTITGDEDDDWENWE